ncbi:MAG: hypothetical protein MPEBLZ_00202 [Candidatus Methanoperedens nitroreducens]|uniref:ArnR1-like winged helix-turn-helix domain-containing protein n=1 Tax=Candidatus Methanoperedens nitratireducens TaxID=1392998 RepID=A0A0P8AK99_9EURY|nr:MAG: hypothetical protein MPEBLZ_00202 [Candidatus Methanoperedens sp. BLZ1]
MQYIDKLLALLQDSKWHKLDEISKNMPVSAYQLNEIIYFLQEQSLIEYENSELKITSKGLLFLNLPI